MTTENINSGAEEIKKPTEPTIPNKYLKDSNEMEKGDEKYLVKDSFLNDKLKEENFTAFENQFLKYDKNETKKEYNIQEIAKSFENISKPEDVNKTLESLPKEVILEITKDPQNFKAIIAIKEWQQKVGGQIGNLSNKRVNYYDNSNKKEAIILGTIPENPKDYLEITANAARFAPKEVSEKFIKDAIDIFLDKNKLTGSGITSFVKSFNKGSGLNIIRNLCESGYKEEAKKILLESLKEETRIKIADRLNIGNSNIMFNLVKDNLFSKEEVQQIFNDSGYLEEKKSDVKNTGWQ